MKTGMEDWSDDAVETALHEAVRQERQSTARVIRCLVEFGRRRLHESRAFPSVFEYCTGRLGYSPQAAYKRSRVARAASDYPEILDILETRRANLSQILAVAAHLTPENHRELLERACRMKIRELEFFVAGLAPQEPKRDSIRPLPWKRFRSNNGYESPQTSDAAPGLPESLSQQAAASTPVSTAAAAGVPKSTGMRQPLDRVEPVASELARVTFTADRSMVADLERACGLLHCGRSNLAPVMGRALRALLEKIDPERRPRPLPRGSPKPIDPSSRYIPQAVRRLVWTRDGGQCTYRDRQGTRCQAQRDIEFDHVRPWALGGRSDDPDNLRLRCKTHNLAEARVRFGEAHVAKAIESARRRQVQRRS